jgi:hypothetical protein
VNNKHKSADLELFFPMSALKTNVYRFIQGISNYSFHRIDDVGILIKRKIHRRVTEKVGDDLGTCVILKHIYHLE